jgi:hypothetical protein
MGQIQPPHVIATSPLAPCGRTQKVTRPGQPILRQVVARPHRTKPGPRSRAMRFRSARPRLREGDEAQLAQVALGIDQQAVGQDGADRGARLFPVGRRVAVVITAAHGW